MAEIGKCLTCGTIFKYYKCNRSGKYCKSKCQYLSEEWKNNIRIKTIGLNVPERFQKGHKTNVGRKHSRLTRIKVSEAKTGDRNPMFGVSGENSPRWKGGVTGINRKIRSSLQYRQWRTKVLIRDNFTCLWCSKKAKIMDVDHIKPFSLYPDLRFEVNNGRVLCRPCHRKTDTYAGRCTSKPLMENIK